MTAVVMTYLFAVSLFASAAAWLADEGLRRTGVPTRWLWLLALVLAPAGLILGALLPPAATDAVAGAVPGDFVFQLPELIVGASEGWVAWSAVVLGAWLLSSFAVIGVVVRAHLRLRSERRGWRAQLVDGRPVYVSRDRGPAVAGVLRPWIVLPKWALELPAAQRDLVLLHEDEHARGGDTRLLPLALALVSLTPWNPVTWWQLGRLRSAMEVDCDRRVLRVRPEPAAYGESLITVAARSAGAGLALAAFSERPHTLRRRILAMTTVTTPWSSLRAAVFTLLAIVVGVQACSVDSPVTLDERGIQQVVPDEPSLSVNPDDPDLSVPPPPTPQRTISELRASPTFTPFTVAPSITNREEVVRAMMESYPPLLRDAGIGGTVRVYFFIGADGRVEQVRLDQSSGHEALDDAALNVAGVYEFTPALNRDEKVPVWVSFPITFQVR